MIVNGMGGSYLTGRRIPVVWRWDAQKSTPGKIVLIHIYSKLRKKRVFRSLMIARINAGLEGYDLNYSRFIHGLSLAGVVVDRSVLSELAVHAPEDFGRLVETAAETLKSLPAKAS